MTNEDGNGNTLKYRVTELECSYKTLNEKVESIMENHLPHLNREILLSRETIMKEIGDLKLAVRDNSVRVAIIVGVLMTVFSVFINKVI